MLPCSACFDVFMTAGHNQAGASSDQGSLVKYMTPKMDERRRSFADLRYVIWCCINLRREQMRFDDGFQLFLGALAPEYVHTTMAKETFNSVLGTLYDRVKKNVLDDLRSFREECLAVGYSGAFLGAQLDLTTAAGEEYITFRVSYVTKGSSDVSRVALATRAFPGTHAADDIKPWIENVRRLLSWYVFCLFFYVSFFIVCLPSSGGS